MLVERVKPEPPPWLFINSSLRMLKQLIREVIPCVAEVHESREQSTTIGTDQLPSTAVQIIVRVCT